MKYADELDDKSWSSYGSGSMEHRSNFLDPDVLLFLEDMIKKAPSRVKLKELAQHYVNLIAEFEFKNS